MPMLVIGGDGIGAPGAHALAGHSSEPKEESTAKTCAGGKTEIKAGGWVPGLFPAWDAGRQDSFPGFGVERGWRARRESQSQRVWAKTTTDSRGTRSCPKLGFFFFFLFLFLFLF